MYPRTWFDTYWRGNLKKEVFVAMPFVAEFDEIWLKGIKPAIEEDLASGGQYKANRVDVTTLSGSIVADIYDGVAHSTLFFSDISMMTSGKWARQRNGNVMYEVGLATAIRPETDMVLVKSDDKEINFDIVQIRVHKYPRGNVDEARKQFATLLTNAITARTNAKSLLAQHTWSLLDRACLSLMHHQRDFRPFSQNASPNDDDRYAIRRLLELGIIRCECPEDLRYKYVWTDFGKAVCANPNRSIVS